MATNKQVMSNLEMEVQQNPMNSKAWQALGLAQAENDQDTQAIRSLERAVQVDPQNLDALAALATSYANDLSNEKALHTLEKGLLSTDEYKHIPAKFPVMPETVNETVPVQHKRVLAMYIDAAKLRSDDPDPDIQIALGLLYNLLSNYEKAVTCYEAALTKRPADYRLWNKLGATLANSSRSEEALAAYAKALDIKPTYVRAISNLGITFLALGSYNESALSFLSAIRLYPNAGGHLWEHLKICFDTMQRKDLVERAAPNDIEAFPEDFSF